MPLLAHLWLAGLPSPRSVPGVFGIPRGTATAGASWLGTRGSSCSGCCTCAPPPPPSNRAPDTRQWELACFETAQARTRPEPISCTASPNRFGTKPRLHLKMRGATIQCPLSSKARQNHPCFVRGQRKQRASCGTPRMLNPSIHHSLRVERRRHPLTATPSRFLNITRVIV